MAKCEVCGNEYDKAFKLIAAGTHYTFDSFECAIQAMAPICEHCKCRVIGHGVRLGVVFFCCAHCARSATSADVKDRAGLDRMTILKHPTIPYRFASSMKWKLPVPPLSQTKLQPLPASRRFSMHAAAPGALVNCRDAYFASSSRNRAASEPMFLIW